MTMAENQNQVEPMPQTSLLRLNKYYICATNGACANCPRGEHGCCSNYLEVRRGDFNIDFTNEEQVKTLFSLGLFTVEASLTCDSVHASIRIKAIKDKRQTICAFWSEIGCRLEHGARPRVCRMHTCPTMEHDVKSYNTEDKLTSLDWKQRYPYTEEEVKVIMKVALKSDISYSMHRRTYNKLDWDKILTILQGHP